MQTQHKYMTWAGWVLTVLITLMLCASATMKFMKPPDMVKEFVERLGYNENVIFPIGIVEVSCVLLYLFPRTAVLGAVLLTGISAVRRQPTCGFTMVSLHP